MKLANCGISDSCKREFIRHADIPEIESIVIGGVLTNV